MQNYLYCLLFLSSALYSSGEIIPSIPNEIYANHIHPLLYQLPPFIILINCDRFIYPYYKVNSLWKKKFEERYNLADLSYYYDICGRDRRYFDSAFLHELKVPSWDNDLNDLFSLKLSFEKINALIEKGFYYNDTFYNEDVIEHMPQIIEKALEQGKKDQRNISLIFEKYYNCFSKTLQELEKKHQEKKINNFEYRAISEKYNIIFANCNAVFHRYQIEIADNECGKISISTFLQEFNSFFVKNFHVRDNTNASLVKFIIYKKDFFLDNFILRDVLEHSSYYINGYSDLLAPLLFMQLCRNVSRRTVYDDSLLLEFLNIGGVEYFFAESTKKVASSVLLYFLHQVWIEAKDVFDNLIIKEINRFNDAFALLEKDEAEFIDDFSAKRVK